MHIQAVIFDLDGTILEDEEEYGYAFGEVLKGLGIENKSEHPQVGGIGVEANWRRFIEKYNIKTDKTVEDLTRETQEIYLGKISEITVRPGFEEAAENLRDYGIYLGLATGSTWEVVDQILKKTDLTHMFDEIVTIEEVAFGKPDPEMFNLVAEKLGVDRKECLVIEDSASGVTAAKRAGMKVFAISTKFNEESEFEDADKVLERFSNLSIKEIESL